jgi:hypothetical protein
MATPPRNSKTEIRKSKLENRNSKPETRKPKFETRNSKLEIRPEVPNFLGDKRTLKSQATPIVFGKRHGPPPKGYGLLGGMSLRLYSTLARG